MVHGAFLASFDLFSLFFVFHKSGLCNLSSNLHFDDFLAPCHSYLYLPFLPRLPFLHFLSYHLLWHPIALPKCLLVHPLFPDSSMSTGASPLSHLLPHMPALNLFPPSSLVFWKQGHLVWRHWGSLHKSCITCQSMWDKLRCTTDPVDVGCNRPQVCCAQHKGGNVQPVAAELRQTLIQV